MARGISAGQERLGLPWGNSSCRGVHAGSPASPFSHLPALLTGAFTPCPLLHWAEWDETPRGEHCLAAPVSRRWVTDCSASPCSCPPALRLNSLPGKQNHSRSHRWNLHLLQNTDWEFPQQGNPEWHFCLWGDGEPPVSELKHSPSQAGFGVSHPPSGPCSSPAVASPSAWAAGREQCWHFPLYFRALISISGSLIPFLLGDDTGRLGKVMGLHYLGFFCRILSVCVSHIWAIPVGGPGLKNGLSSCCKPTH